LSNARDELLELQFEFRKNPTHNLENELAVIILKPDFTVEQQKMLADFINQHSLEVVCERRVTLSYEAVLAVYNDIYRFNTNDIQFGHSWKHRKLDYMRSGESQISIVRGRNAQSLSEELKYRMREDYGKLSVPDKKLDGDEFEELAIKNVIHVVDATETEVAIWLFAK
jgi:hypothetical protein